MAFLAVLLRRAWRVNARRERRDARGPAGEQIPLQAHLLDEVDAAVMLLDFSGEHAMVCYWSEGAQRLYATRPRRRWAAC